MRREEGHFILNHRNLELALKCSSFLFLSIGILRLHLDEPRGLAAELCYSAGSFFYSRTFNRENHSKALDFALGSLLIIVGRLIDTMPFMPIGRFTSG